MRIAKDLQAGDIVSFLVDTYRQGWWPFFHSWLLAPAFILFGHTPAVARGVSLFCLIVLIPTLYLVCLEISTKRGHWAGLITSYLALTSLPILLLSSTCMNEMPGVLMTSASLLLYLKAIKHQKPFMFFWTSILITLTFFTKWHHGVIVISAVFLTQLSDSRNILSKNNCYLCFPFLALMIGWFIYPEHIFQFFRHSTFQPHFYRFGSLENWIYYPKSLLNTYHCSVAFSIPILISFIYALKRLKDPRIRLLATHFLVGMTLMTVKLDNSHRYIVSIVPSVWVLGASQIAEGVWCFKARIRSKTLQVLGASTVLSAFFVISLMTVPELYRTYPEILQKHMYSSDEKPNKAYKFISKNVKNHDHFAVFCGESTYNFIHSTTIKWNKEVDRGYRVLERQHKKERIYCLLGQFLKQRDRKSFNSLIHFLRSKDIEVYGYHLLSFMYTVDRGAYLDYVENEKVSPFSTMTSKNVQSIDDNIRCLIAVYNEEEKEFRHYAEEFFEKYDEWTEVTTRKFDDLAITIAIYERGKAPSGREILGQKASLKESCI